MTIAPRAPPHHAKYAKLCRDRAAELRQMIFVDRATRDTLMRIAMLYDRCAERLEATTRRQ